ncbi:hypothetical protein BH09PSE4_BH09PSE4_05620 [soil metagenome]
MTTKFSASDLRSTFAAIACAFVFSSACVLSAVGPVQASPAKTTTETAVRPLA